MPADRRARFQWLGGALFIIGAVLAVYAITKGGKEHFTAFASGAVAWAAGWLVFAFGIEPKSSVEPVKSPAVGFDPYPRLAKYRDFYATTFVAYGAGILLSELVLILVHTLLASGAASGGEAEGGIPPPLAFSIALTLASVVAFIGGFIGAGRAKRLSIPEATIAIIYLGLPVPALLSAMNYIPKLGLSLGFYLREVTYFAGLLGRPDLGYWLVFVGLVLMLLLGITSGFVATASGELDLRAGFELFVARRHVNVFRPRLMLMAYVVLQFLVIPPLLLYGMLSAANAAVEGTRLRKLGLKDPLLASGALHQLKGKEQTPIALMTAISMGGVGLGVMALIIVMSVMSGFEVDLQQKILGTNAHALVTKYSEPIENYDEVMKKIDSVAGITGKTPFILNEVMLTSEGGGPAGVMIKGIDPQTVGSVTDLPSYMLAGGSLSFLEHPETISTRLNLFDDKPALEKPKSPAKDEDDDVIIRKPTKAPDDKVLPGVVLGRELALQMRVAVGDRLNVVSPIGDVGPQGPMPKSRPFRVAGIFYSGFFEYDSKFAYITIGEAEKFFGMKGVTGIELKVADIDDARRVSKAVYDKLEGYPYRTKDWGEMNRNLFSALRLEKLVMAIILCIIVIIAGCLIIATAIMLVLEKRKEISVLKALGVSDGGIVKIFLLEGLQIGVAGGLIGLIAGLGGCFFLEKVGVKLDPEVYYIPSLPVRIEPVQTALSVIVAILVTFLASIYPALKASQVEPVDGLKAE